jgi:(E)-4-hydroxy-3-methylbut-2-enyl-diphosphate synthase
MNKKEISDLITKAKELRNNMTHAEIMLWSRLRMRHIDGYKFRRQQVIFGYIVDFYCHELKLIIEVDGEIHSLPEQVKKDKSRNKILKINGYHIFRLSNIDIEIDLTDSVNKLKSFISTISSPSQGDHRGSSGNTLITNNPSPSQGDHRGFSGNNLITNNPSPSQGDHRGSSGNTLITNNPSPSQGDHRGSSYRSAVIHIGTVPLGGTNPIRLQSMTNTDTLDTKASIAQCIRIIEAGADFVRLTAQGVREAENLANIKSALHKAGFDTPLIADIHFNPAAAETAARLVEKVRINPGNYADKRASFRKIEFSEKEYDEELERIHSRILPLINICHEYNTAVRIGVNHGSLSDRIMTRYGNTPEGMAVSAMEFIRIFRSENFHRLVLSLKSSDTAVMIKATRRLVELMTDEDFAYPLHLGVTEAGEGEDGRIRSAAGIGALVSEGLGDTIRVSLSEAPEQEIPVAKEIIRVLTGSEGRIAEPAKTTGFKARNQPYKPEVLTYEGGNFINESGARYTDKVLAFNADTLIIFPDHPNDKIILNPVFNEDDPEKLAIDSASLLGKYFITKQADGICISNNGKVKGEKLKELCFSILQTTGARITRVVYLSCPTCGRTKFDLQEAVKKVKAITGHLSGLKIAVMGCIVNGPGEMADADYGYVGAENGKVHIYRGMVPVLKNVPQQSAAEELLKIIEGDQKKV